jgi:hypothetical protein
MRKVEVGSEEQCSQFQRGPIFMTGQNHYFSFKSQYYFQFSTFLADFGVKRGIWPHSAVNDYGGEEGDRNICGRNNNYDGKSSYFHNCFILLLP